MAAGLNFLGCQGYQLSCFPVKPTGMNDILTFVTDYNQSAIRRLNAIMKMRERPRLRLMSLLGGRQEKGILHFSGRTVRENGEQRYGRIFCLCKR